MRDPAQSIRDRLVAQGIGVFGSTTGWSINIGQFPDSPDTVVLINQTGGRNPFPHLLYNEPSVQVMVRGSKNGYTSARTKIGDVVRALLGLSSQTLQGDMYRSCNQLGDISYLGQDESNRPMFTANFWFVVLPAEQAGDLRLPIT